MLTAEEISKYTGNKLDYYICSFLMYETTLMLHTNGCGRGLIVEQIEQLLRSSRTSLKFTETQISNRLRKLNSLNIITGQRMGSNYKWKFNTSIASLDDINSKDATITIIPNKNVVPNVIPIALPTLPPGLEHKLKNPIVVTTITADKPDFIVNTPSVAMSSNSEVKQNKLLNISTGVNTITDKVKKLSITNNSEPCDNNLFYYFIRYKLFVGGKPLRCFNEIIALPFTVYTSNHLCQIEKQLLETNINKADTIETIILQKL